MLSPSQPSAYLPELLSPAGNWECARAAVANGANAIYFGLPRFNARLRADNFGEDDLPELMEFLHSHGVKGFVTMNTLVFPGELDDAVGYLQTLDATGVDGVIVQDLGLAFLVKKAAPRLELHASTQMTLSSPEGIDFINHFLPLDRAVLSRELSVDDIGRCHTQDIPLEVFVHGALCVSYSGQCLTSESLGQRSANRGECAQACRMPYELISDGETVPMGERRYLLSPQDLQAIDSIPGLVAQGVKSFKIEGRLKSPEYVAAVTAVYRKALDAACAGVPMRQAISPHDRYSLEMVFSRGFAPGWLEGANHPRLTHGRHGKKRGVYMGMIDRVGKGWVEMKLPADIPIAPGDGFVFDAGEDRNHEQGGRIWKLEDDFLLFHGKIGNIDWRSIQPGMKLWKTDDPALNAEIRKSWKGIRTKPQKQTLHLRVSGKAGQALELTAPDFGISVVSEELLMPAEKRPLTQEVLENQLGRLGDSPFEAGKVENLLEGEVILPLSALNRLRRSLVEQIQDSGISLPTPDAGEPKVAPTIGANADWRDLLISLSPPPSEKNAAPVAPELRVLCRHLHQEEALLRAGASFLYLDFEDIRRYEEGVKMARRYPGVQVFLATPRIQKPGEQGFFRLMEKAAPDGILARNWGALEYFRDKEFRLIGDFSLNIANPLSAALLLRHGGLENLTVSYDLNVDQVLDLLCDCPAPRMEIVLHQHMPLFHMEHCVFCAFLSDGENFKNCGRPCEKHVVHLRDRVGQEHRLMADAGCRNTLYNGRAQTGARYYADFRRAGATLFRLDLLDDSGEEAVSLWKNYSALIQGERSADECLSRLDAIERLGVTEGTLRK